MLELRNLSAGYGKELVLRNIDLDLPAGQVTAIVGPNGCGKSTLFRSILGLTPHMEVKIFIDGQDAAGLSSAALARQIAYLPQSKRTPDMTVEQLVLHGRFPYLRYPRRYRPEDRDAARRAMEAMGVAHLAKENLATLSGGTRQKCYIAMALAQDSPTILMDEPLSFLDISHQLQLMELIRQLAGQGKAMVLVIHDLALALRYADRIAVMEKGQLRTVGTAEEVYESGLLGQVFGVEIRRYSTPFGVEFSFQNPSKT